MSYFFIQLGGGNQGSNLSELGGNPMISRFSERVPGHRVSGLFPPGLHFKMLLSAGTQAE